MLTPRISSPEVTEAARCRERYFALENLQAYRYACCERKNIATPALPRIGQSPCSKW